MDNKVRHDIENKKEQYRKNVQVIAKAMEENDDGQRRIFRKYLNKLIESMEETDKI